MTHTASLWRTGGTKIMSAASTLRTMCVNVLDSPGILKYRRVRVTKVDGLLPEAVLAHCGFSRVTYPDDVYWVMQKVDETLLRGVVRELDLAMSTAQSLCKRSASASESAQRESILAAALVLSKENNGLRDLVPAQGEAPHGLSSSTAPASQTDMQRLQTAAKEAPSLECQLRARSAAHKFSAAMTPPSHRHRAVGAVCATGLAMGLALLAAWVVGLYAGETTDT